MKVKYWHAHAALLTVTIIFSLNYIVAKDVMTGPYVKPLAFIFMRAGFAAPMFWIFHLIFVRERLQRQDFPLVMLCGLLGVAINQSFFFSGLEKTTPIHASLIMTLVPVIILIFSSMLINERITIKKMVGIGLGAIGATLLITEGQQVGMQKSQVLGDAMVFINAMSYSLYVVLVKKLMVKYHPFTVVKWVFTFGFIYMIPVAWKQISTTQFETFPADIWLGILFVLVFATFFAYFLNVFALIRVNASTAGSYLYLQTLLASILSLMFAMDGFSWMKVISGLMIFIAVSMVSNLRFPSKKAKSAPN